MSESAYLYLANPRITVLGVQHGTPPFRIVEIDGEVVGKAKSVTDVLDAAAMAGITVKDLDDPDAVRWVGGDKFTWQPGKDPIADLG
ncbi:MULTISPECIES: hypothetical protein [Streptomyces]|uniref:hypothetical protein n=1 Tax=Streptomyces TaxID=1883 RepID=UPI0006EB7F51|nr:MULTISPECIES: hypothetical protein [Streptomyces]